MSSQTNASVIAILGMHRSGTSCLTGMLEDAGLNLGSVSRKNPYNRKGNHENQDIVALHEAVLASNGCSWSRPPVGGDGCRWTHPQLRQMRGILEEYGQLRPWGFKDPRTLFTLERWIDQLPEMRLIGTFRHPAAVVRSLTARGGGAASAYLELWWLYNRRLLLFLKQFGFDLVCFDDPRDRYVAQVSVAAKKLGLHPSSAELTFFDEDLRTQRGHGDIALPTHVERLYEDLLARSLR